MLDQLNAPIDSEEADADLRRTQQIVLELTNELRNRVDDVTSRMDAIDNYRKRFRMESFVGE
jgi:hypothetical protein